MRGNSRRIPCTDKENTLIKMEIIIKENFSRGKNGGWVPTTTQMEINMKENMKMTKQRGKVRYNRLIKGKFTENSKTCLIFWFFNLFNFFL